MEQQSAPVELIVYACPVGELERQALAFYDASRARFGANSAHAYPPHITLTGFFHDLAAAIPGYVAALSDALLARPRRPPDGVVVRELARTAAFHGLLIDSPWLEQLAAAFAARAASPTGLDVIRVKRDLHLSLAYGFRPEDGPALGALARELVDPAAPASWELRLYERTARGDWRIHAAWPL
jgi:ubiquitin-associated SH3 domain-containing protein